MLSWLRIRDLAIIHQLELELGSGLNVITGETGAGKSILVSALELLLGAPARSELIRTGAKQAEVEALFEVGEDAAVRAKLETLGVAVGDELAIRRVISEGGRSRAFVNGQLTTRPQLAELARGLMDISSQHEHHTLSNPATHLSFLDAFGRLQVQKRRVRDAYFALRQAQTQLQQFEDKLRDRDEREQRLRAQIQEIEGLAPKPGEDAQLERDAARLRHTETLLALSAEASELLYECDGSVVESLARATGLVEQAAVLDVELEPLSAQLEQVRIQVEEYARSLGRHAHSLRADPEALHHTEERLHQLSKCKRRYGGTLEAVIEQLQKSKEELEALHDHAGTSEQLRAAYTGALSEACEAAGQLSNKRRQSATRLGAAISRELDSLGMGEARIVVEVSPISSAQPGAVREVVVNGAGLGPEGADRAEFLIAPNRGEEARPLHRVASGGELSRAMLAIKCVLADIGPAGMYAFDEVDTGIGGGMAEIIGRKIYSVSRHRQVLCITHLPQIAVFADQHFKVQKAVQGERTLTTVWRLSRKEQHEEIARMLGGLEITSKTRAAAKEMLSQAKNAA